MMAGSKSGWPVPRVMVSMSMHHLTRRAPSWPQFIGLHYAPPALPIRAGRFFFFCHCRAGTAPRCGTISGFSQWRFAPPNEVVLPPLACRARAHGPLAHIDLVVAAVGDVGRLLL